MIRRRVRASFAAGDLGFNFIWQSLELYLLYFYVRVLGLPPVTASAIFLAGAIIDFVIDPFVGTVVDRAASRIGMRLWVLIGGSAASVALIVAFAQPPMAAAPAAFYALAAHLVLRVAYSVGNIPYGALTTRISAEAIDQVALTTARMQGAAIGGLIAAIVYATLPARGAHGHADFLAGAILLGVLAQPAFLATFFGVRERVASGPDAVTSMRENLRVLAGMLRRSPDLRRVLLTILAAGLSVTVMNKSILFLFDRLDAMRIGYFVAAVPSLSLLLTAPLWLAVARRFGCVATLLAASGLNVAAAVSLPLAGANLGGVMLAATTALVAGCGMSVMFWSLLPPAVATVERQYGGVACAARVYALGGIARKLAQALAPQFVALAVILSASRSVVPAIVAASVLTCATIMLYRPRDAMPLAG